MSETNKQIVTAAAVMLAVLVAVAYVNKNYLQLETKLPLSL